MGYALRAQHVMDMFPLAINSDVVNNSSSIRSRRPLADVRFLTLELIKIGPKFSLETYKANPYFDSLDQQQVQPLGRSIPEALPRDR